MWYFRFNSYTTRKKPTDAGLGGGGSYPQPGDTKRFFAKGIPLGHVGFSI